MSKILLYQEPITGVTTEGTQYAFFINENGLPTVKQGSQVTTFGTSGYAMQGSSGSSGINGTNGLSGTSGISGTSGQDGAPGEIGPGGSSGSSGYSGTSGINGVDGATGISGTSGVDGTFFGSSGSSGVSGVGIPDGGTTGQVLAKASSTDFDTEWVNQSGGGGGGGLVAGTGANSMKNADSLVTTPAIASSVDDIVLGNGAADNRNDATYGSNVIIGTNASVTGGEWNVVIGKDARANKGGGVTIGKNAVNLSGLGIVIGLDAYANGADEQLVIGTGASGGGNAGAITIGRQATTGAKLNNIAIGRNANGNGEGCVSLGPDSAVTNDYGVAVGRQAAASGIYSVSIGVNTSATAEGAVALGSFVTAEVANYTTTKNLQLTNYAALNFADDTAAATGGVPLGGVYHTNGILKIRISG